jgi:hypothetical protein
LQVPLNLSASSIGAEDLSVKEKRTPTGLICGARYDLPRVLPFFETRKFWYGPQRRDSPMRSVCLSSTQHSCCAWTS